MFYALRKVTKQVKRYTEKQMSHESIQLTETELYFLVKTEHLVLS